MALDKSVLILYTYTYILFFALCGGQSGTATEGTQGGLRENKVCNKLCPMKKRQVYYTTQSNRVRSGGRRGRRERKIKAGTFIGARKIRKRQNKKFKRLANLNNFCKLGFGL